MTKTTSHKKKKKKKNGDPVLLSADAGGRRVGGRLVVFMWRVIVCPGAEYVVDRSIT